MNFLAHAYLSFNDDEVLLGNMMNDFLKGVDKSTFSTGVQKGIKLHRAIDSFTDTHIATQQAKIFFKPHYRLYSAPIVDVVFDHFLATDKKEFTPQTLIKFAKDVYFRLDTLQSVMPEKFRQIFEYMKRQNWLQGYAEKQNIYHSLNGLKRRSKYLEEMEMAFTIFEKEYDEIKNCFDILWIDLKNYSKNLYDDKNF